jgi:hypothetical protein
MACYNRLTAIWELKLGLASSVQDSSAASSRSPRPIPEERCALALAHARRAPRVLLLAAQGLPGRRHVEEGPHTGRRQGTGGPDERPRGGCTWRACWRIRSSAHTYSRARASVPGWRSCSTTSSRPTASCASRPPIPQTTSGVPLAKDGRKWVLASRSAELVFGRLEDHGGRLKVSWKPSILCAVSSSRSIKRLY